MGFIAGVGQWFARLRWNRSKPTSGKHLMVCALLIIQTDKKAGENIQVEATSEGLLKSRYKVGNKRIEDYDEKTT